MCNIEGVYQLTSNGNRSLIADVLVRQYLLQMRCRLNFSKFCVGFKHGRRNQSLNVVITGHFCLGWCSNFVGSESGQKQSVKLLQNTVYNTTHRPHPLPPATHCLYILYVYIGKRGGGGQREGRGATVHKRGRKYQHDWLYHHEWMYLQSIKSVKYMPQSPLTGQF